MAADSPGASLCESAATTQPVAPNAARMSELLDASEASRSGGGEEEVMLDSLAAKVRSTGGQDCGLDKIRRVQRGQKPPDRVVTSGP
ncbi:hypothetical protein GCM10008949_10850 [Deinococcus humi]|nr:hypothetical protein GCM10008949_10850 [Deinococcus humi]